MSNRENVFRWIEENLYPKPCTSEDFVYNEMESQSGFSLPVIYQDFDAGDRWHWNDRGMLYDFLYSTDGEGKVLLDFGPGDGWPSLIVAPFAKEVIGVDASEKRVRVCTENAKRLGIKNASFASYKSGTGLPFEDNTFDGIMAASSIEQTPNPKETLKELYRVLKPDGHIRIFYESLNDYRNGLEKELWILGLGNSACKMILFDRNPEKEYAMQYGLKIEMAEEELKERLSAGDEVRFDQVSVKFLEEIKGRITTTQVLKTLHPSAKTWVSWMKETGFKKVLPTHSGGMAALKLFDLYTGENRPKDLATVDEAVKRVVKVVTGLEAPIDIDPMITAVK